MTLENELARRAIDGRPPMTRDSVCAELAKLGYVLDRTMDCFSYARYMTGPAAGESYPSVSLCILEDDTQRSFCNVDSRRDTKYRALQDIRKAGTHYWVHHGRIYEL